MKNNNSPTTESKVRFRLYKKKKNWVVAGLTTAFFLTGFATQTNTQQVEAETTSTTEDTQVNENSTEKTNVIKLGSADSSAIAEAKKAALANKEVTGQEQKITAQSAETPTNTIKDYQDSTKTYEAAEEKAKAELTNEITDYQAKLAAYNSELDAYNTNVAAKAPGNITTDKTIADSLNAQKDKLSGQYDELVALANTIQVSYSEKMTEPLAALQVEFDKLTDEQKTAAATIKANNDNVTETSVDLATEILQSATKTATEGQTADLAKLKTTMDTVAQQNVQTPVIVSSGLNSAGKVSATIYGVEYIDRNYDGMITYEDDIIPEMGSVDTLAKTSTAFLYLKTVADTVLSTIDDDGNTIRAQSIDASGTASTELWGYGNGLSKMISSVSQKADANLIGNIQTQLTNLTSTVKQIYSEAGIAFDEDAFNIQTQGKLKEIAKANYIDQTNKFIEVLQDAIATWTEASKDPDWSGLSNTATWALQLVHSVLTPVIL